MEITTEEKTKEMIKGNIVRCLGIGYPHWKGQKFKVESVFEDNTIGIQVYVDAIIRVAIEDFVLSSKVVHCKKEPYDIYIGRPTKWGNPFSDKRWNTAPNFQVKNRQEAIEKHKEWILTNTYLMKDLQELKGKTLGCWCKPKPCHGDILVELIDKLTSK